MASGIKTSSDAHNCEAKSHATTEGFNAVIGKVSHAGLIKLITIPDKAEWNVNTVGYAIRCDSINEAGRSISSKIGSYEFQNALNGFCSNILAM